MKNFPCCVPQPNGPRIVSHAAPRKNHFAIGGAREIDEGGELPQESLVDDDDATHLRLLKHHLGNHDAVRPFGIILYCKIAPREIALMDTVPTPHLADEFFDVFTLCHERKYTCLP